MALVSVLEGKVTHPSVYQIVQSRLQPTLTSFLFEQNDRDTRYKIIAALQNEFDQLRMQRIIVDYKIVCDDTNNLPSNVDNGEINISAFYKEYRGINFTHVAMVIK